MMFTDVHSDTGNSSLRAYCRSLGLGFLVQVLFDRILLLIGLTKGARSEGQKPVT